MPAYELSGITASVSPSLPSGPHMCPDVRIIAGIEASTMTSDGTCRLVMPRSESTIASGGGHITELLEHGREEGAHGVAEDDRIGHLHHRRLEVQREQHAVGLGAGDL